jgi:hypothetical protein
MGQVSVEETGMSVTQAKGSYLSVRLVQVANLKKYGRSLAIALVCLAHFGTRAAAQNVTMQHNDIGRTGQNTNETILTPANVNKTTFGKLFSHTVDGYVYAQPLYVAGVTMGAGTVQAGTTHNVVFIVTQHDSVYAFDADTNGGANANPLWQVTMLDSAHGAAANEKTVPNSDVSTSDIVPEIGITSTPVIDTSSNTIYVVSKATVGDTSFVQRLHALDITTGQEKFGGPAKLMASVPGTGNGSSGGNINFDPKWENNRPGSLLLNGIVYLGFAAHGDQGPYHGWVLAYDAKTLALKSAYCASPNGAGSGIWMSGSGLAADVPAGKPFGRLFVATGNGTYDATMPYGNNMDFGDDNIRLDLSNGVMTAEDAFTPMNQASLNSSDTDLGSGGALLLPDQPGAHTHMMVQGGKQGILYIMDRDNLGDYSTSKNTDLGEISTSGLWSMPAYWNNFIYVWGNGGRLQAYSINNGVISTSPASTSTFTLGYPGATPSISSNGTTNGIVWALQTDLYGANGTSVLHALSATNVATELYNSAQNGTNDLAGPIVKFAVPTVINGKVYVGTSNQMDVYGLKGGTQQAATPVINPAGSSFTGSIPVTITDSTGGATIYYTTDGSMPTTASTKYTGPITVSTTETISAVASATGLLTSPATSQTYTLQTQVVMPTFTPGAGSYVTAQSVTISDATPNNQIYYTTDGTTPSPGVGTTQLYSAAISIGATATLKAIATASGLTASPVASSTYTITLGGTGINFTSGFAASASTMAFNGSTGLDDTRLQLTNGGLNQAGSAFFNTPVNIQSFTSDFSMQLTNPQGADGITFTIQGVGPTALGCSGGGLGYGPDMPTNPDPCSGTPIAKSVAIKFDFYSNAGEGTDSTGLYQNGASPTTPAIDMTSSGVNLLSNDAMSIHLTYDGTTLAMTVTDGVVGKTFSTSWAVNIPNIVGGNSAYVGFTGGTGGATSSQKILTWTFTSASGSTQTAGIPGILPAAGTYTLPVSVTMSDGTTGAAIHYTTDGSTPTATSPLYSGAIALTGPTTVKAIAVASGLANSAAASNAYAIQAATPLLNPGPGTYTATQNVTITDTTPNSNIFYTLNGTTPTASSSPYSGPVFVGSTQTLSAIATATGLVNSAVVSGQYTINTTPGSGTTINFGSGFSSAGIGLVGSATLNGSNLQLTDTGTYEAGAAWYSSPVNIQTFTTDFAFSITPGTTPTGDGFTFAIQGNGPTAIGPFGGGLGYGPDSTSGTPGILNSVAVKFDLYSNGGEGVDSTGLFLNGASPTVPFVDMTGSPIDLHSGHPFKVHITYDGTNLAMTITDATTNGTFSHSWPVNIPGTVGGNTAYLGFTGGTGGDTAIQAIQTWTFSSGGVTQTQAAIPTFSPAGGVYTSAQSVTISSTTGGATIYYTTDGVTTPTTASTKYTAPVSVGSTETIQAIAVATGFTNSNVGSAAYTINSGGGSTTINYGSGFTAAGLTLNGVAALNGTRLRLTNSGANQAGTGWFSTPVSVSSFTTDFTFQLGAIGSSAYGNGMTFVIQNTGTSAIGPTGGGLGYGPDNTTNASPSANTPIAKSVAIKFDIVNNAGEGTNSTGLYQNGASPTMPAVTLGGGVNLRSGDTFKAHVTYDGTTLTLALTDQVNTTQTFTTSWTVNIPSVVGGSTAYVGFTGATGNSVANQDVVTWTYSSGSSGGGTPKTPITYATTGLPAVSSGPTFRVFAYGGFPDGNGTILDASKVGDNVTLTVNVPTAGLYDVKYSYKTINTRGVAQLSIDGTNVGGTLDQYLAGESYNTFDCGTFNFATAGSYLFKFTVVGKNASSAGYSMAFDDIILTPQ